MERISRKERRLVQGARDRIMRDKRCPIEFACCGACDYLIRVCLGENGRAKACPQCGWNLHVMGGRWAWRALANAI